MSEKEYITYLGHYRIPTTGLEKIRYLIEDVQFIFCHNCGFIFPIDLLGFAEHFIYHNKYCQYDQYDQYVKHGEE